MSFFTTAYKKLRSFFKNDLCRIFLSLVLFLPALILQECGAGLLSVILFLLSLLVSGVPIFADAVKGLLHRDLLDEKFLMSLAAIGSVILGDFAESSAVMIFFLIGEYFEHRAVRKSRESIRSLMDIRPDEATLYRNGEEERVDAEDVTVGSEIIIRTGERIPIDSLILSGNADVDTSALTGESVPRSVAPGDTVESGTVVLSGVLIAKTLRPADESAAARILSLVEDANDRKSKEEAFITKFSHFYTPAVVIGALLLAAIPPIFRLLTFRAAVSRALTFLVISCPCALVISVPMAFFGGIGCAASHGILFKGGNTFSPVAKASVFAFDKTGTLTTGEFSVSQVLPAEIPETDLLRYAASCEYGSNHPIALAIKKACRQTEIPTESKEIPGKGTTARVGEKSVAVGNAALMRDVGAKIPDARLSGAGYVYVAVDGEYVGAITLSDRVKPNAKAAMEALARLGVKKTVILSGDRPENAEKVCAALSIDECEAGLLPAEKYEKLEALIAAGNGKTVFVGDGINDAPSLARADVGVAMGGIGADSAIEAADLVVMSDDLSRLPEAIRIARKTLRIAKENIVFALFVKLSVLILGALGLAPMWLAIFADVGVAVLAILNSMRTLAAKAEE